MKIKLYTIVLYSYVFVSSAMAFQTQTIERNAIPDVVTGTTYDSDFSELSVQKYIPDVPQTTSDIDYNLLTSFLFERWWNGTQKYLPGNVLSVMAWEGSSSWANWSMWQLSRIPRETFDFNVHDRLNSTVPWLNLYETINDGLLILQAIENGVQITNSSGANVTDQAKAFAHFNIGISYGFLSSFFVSGYILDTDDVNFANTPLSSPGDLLNEAFSHLDKAINASTFSGNISWIPGEELNAVQFESLVKSYKARYTLTIHRDLASRVTTDWNALVTLTENRVQTDFAPYSDGNTFWNRNFLSQNTTWFRTSLLTIGKYDQSNNFANWKNLPWVERNMVTISTPDKRIMEQTANGPNPTGAGTDFGYLPNTQFNQARGTYYNSHYHHLRYAYYMENGAVGRMPHLLVAEMDLIRAEALIQSNGDREEAVSLINKTRVTRGGLTPALVTDSNDDLLDMLYYERDIELMNTAAGLAYFDKRGRDKLEPGTTKEFIAATIATPNLISPEPNATNTGTEVTVSVASSSSPFFVPINEFSVSIGKSINLQNNTITDINDVIFNIENTSVTTFDLPTLEENTTYYIKVQGRNTEISVNSLARYFAFSTNIQTQSIGSLITSTNQKFVQVEGTIVYPLSVYGTFLNDETGGIQIRISAELRDRLSLEMGDKVRVAGDLQRYNGDFLEVTNYKLNVLERNTELPAHQEITHDRLFTNLDQLGTRPVYIKNVTVVGTNWPTEPTTATISVQVAVNETENTFWMIIPRDSELMGTPKPEGIFTLKGISWQPGIVSYFLTDIDDGLSTSTSESLYLPIKYDLAQNYPNPFNPTTTIRFDLPESANVSIRVYNLLGQEVAVLANSMYQAGRHTIDFNASSLASGMYIYRLESEAYTMSRKFMLIK
jgi:uncharacterized protein YdeI (BOF family)